MTEAFCVWAILASVPVALAARSYHAFILEDADEVARDIERRVAEPEEDDEPAANDNGNGSAAA